MRQFLCQKYLRAETLSVTLSAWWETRPAHAALRNKTALAYSTWIRSIKCWSACNERNRAEEQASASNCSHNEGINYTVALASVPCGSSACLWDSAGPFHALFLALQMEGTSILIACTLTHCWRRSLKYCSLLRKRTFTDQMEKTPLIEYFSF